MRRFLDRLTETVVALTIVFVGCVFGYALAEVAVAVIAANAAEAVVPVAPEPPAPVLAPPVVELPAEAPVINSDDLMKKARQACVLAYAGGMLLEAMANATPAYTPGSAFAKSFFKHAGVQIQIAVLTDADLVPHDPAAAFATGFLIGL